MQNTTTYAIPAGHFRQAATFLLTAAAIMIFTGCATFRGPEVPPLTVSQIISAAKEGVPSDTIIARMQASGTVYRLDATQLARLEKEGVPGPVINYMQQTYLDAVRRDTRYRDAQFWGEDNSFWYGNETYGWPMCPSC